MNDLNSLWPSFQQQNVFTPLSFNCSKRQHRFNVFQSLYHYIFGTYSQLYHVAVIAHIFAALNYNPSIDPQNNYYL